MEIKDFKKGQTVYIRLTGNKSRYKSGEELIEEWEIVSVGTKLIKAKKKGWSDSVARTFEKRSAEKAGTNAHEILIIHQFLLPVTIKSKVVKSIAII